MRLSGPTPLGYATCGEGTAVAPTLPLQLLPPLQPLARLLLLHPTRLLLQPLAHLAMLHLLALLLSQLLPLLRSRRRRLA